MSTPWLVSPWMGLGLGLFHILLLILLSRMQARLVHALSMANLDLRAMERRVMDLHHRHETLLNQIDPAPRTPPETE